MTRVPMELSYDLVLETLGIRPIGHFSNSRESLSPRERLKQVRFQAQRFREDFKLINQQIRFIKAVDLVSLPYPVRKAFSDAANLINPYLYVTSRMFIIQFDTHAGLKTLLFSPSDITANYQTPYFKKAFENNPFNGKGLGSWLIPVRNTVESALQEAGISPEQVDFISFDHLHTQDLRRWLGSYEQPAYFPNAKLLVMHQEWESAKDALPMQTSWYCPDGLDGIDQDKIIPLHSSVMLGDSVALIHTPGHTLGHHSLVANTDQGIMVSSHNGVSIDNYHPELSKIYGIADYSRQRNIDVIPSGVVKEALLDQYISMVLEKSLADPHPEDDRFRFLAPVSEIQPRWFPFSLAATLSNDNLQFGEAENASVSEDYGSMVSV